MDSYFKGCDIVTMNFLASQYDIRLHECDCTLEKIQIRQLIESDYEVRLDRTFKGITINYSTDALDIIEVLHQSGLSFFYPYNMCIFDHREETVDLTMVSIIWEKKISSVILTHAIEYFMMKLDIPRFAFTICELPFQGYHNREKILE